MSPVPPGVLADARAIVARIESLQAALKRIESLAPGDVVDDPSLLQSAILAALAAKAPGGSPAQIHSASTVYGRTAEQYDQAFQDLQKIRVSKLPASWKGLTAHAAAQQIQGLEIQFENTVAAFGLVSEALLAWGDALLQAQHTDDQGRELLTQAAAIHVGPVAEGRGLVLGGGMSIEQASTAAGEALALAADGCSDRATAAQDLFKAWSQITPVLTQATTFARARQVVDAGDVSSSIVTLLANVLDPLNPDGTPILSSYALAAGQQRFDALSAADRTAAEALIASSVSPQEAAYTWKALAAGNSVKTVEGFDKAIRPYGNNQQWLAEHLTPDLTGQPGQMLNQGKGYFATYKGQQGGNLDVQGWDIYDQGNINDCLAASTVVAKATVDPVYMLGLTTGYKAGAASIPTPVNDSAAAFHTRLQQTYVGTYHAEQAAGNKDQWAVDTVANQLLDPSSGSYDYQWLNNAAQRQEAFSQIAATAGSGQPVIIDAHAAGEPASAAGGHQVVAVAYNQATNQLEIYNPWGFTQNVTQQQFVDGQLPINTDGKPDGALPVVYGVEMPG